MRKLLIAIIFTVINFQSFSQDQSTIMQEWNEFKTFLKSELPAYYSRLNNGCDKASLLKFEGHLGLQLPDEFIQLYQTNNGEVNSHFIGGVMCGLKMLSINEILVEHQVLVEIEEDYEFNTSWSGNIYPLNAIKKYDFNSKWIPIFTDQNGNYIGIDLDPGSKGVKGQVINFGTDEYDRFVIANSLSEFLALVNEQLTDESIQKAIFENDSGDRVLFGLEHESHLTGDLKRLVLK